MNAIRSMLTKIKNIRKFSLPGWLYLAAMVVFHEVVVHLWVETDFLAARLLAIALFAAGYGAFAGLLTSFIPSPKWQKITVMILGTAVTLLWLTEFFVFDAYQVYMTLDTIVGGADGVADDYLSVALSLILRNLWRIGLMLLPTVLYGLFCKVTTSSWKIRTGLAGFTAATFLAGFLCVGSTDPFTVSFDFDNAVHNLGLSTALTMGAVQGPAQEQEPVFIAATIPTEATQPAEEAPSVPDPTAPTEVVYGDQVIEGLDFAELAATSGYGNISEICNHLDTLPTVKKNAYTGLFAGKNLVLITAEAFTLEAIDPELTPTLYRLANKGIRFTDFYQPAWGASTTGGEFANITGFMPTTGGACMQEANQQKLFLTMGHQLDALGYTSFAYHNNNADFYHRDTTHTKLGYDKYIAVGTGLEHMTSEWPRSDREMFELTIDDYIHNQPFSVYYMTVSGHSPYAEQNAQCRRHFAEVAHLDYSDKVKNYLATQLELELALKLLVERLEEEGILNDTVIALATDHYPYGLAKSNTWENSKDHMAELFGVESCDTFIRDHNALILWSGCIEDLNLVVDTPVFSLDMLPTLSNLFGVEYDSRLLVGRDVFSDQMPLVFWPNLNWKTDKGTYNYSKRTFIPNEGVTVPEGYVEAVNALVSNRIEYCRSVSSKNFFFYLAKYLNK